MRSERLQSDAPWGNGDLNTWVDGQCYIDWCRNADLDVAYEKAHPCNGPPSLLRPWELDSGKVRPVFVQMDELDDLPLILGSCHLNFIGEQTDQSRGPKLSST